MDRGLRTMMEGRTGNNKCEDRYSGAHDGFTSTAQGTLGDFDQENATMVGARTPETNFDLVEDLRQLIANKPSQVLAIVGAGVSVAVTDHAEVASWVGLLRNGVARCVVLSRANEEWARRRRDDLESGDTDELLSVAQQVSSKLGAPTGPEYGNWLAGTVGCLRVQQPDVLSAVADLGIPLATTNYDGQIEEVTGLPPVTWRQSGRVEQILRGDARGVLHLHGHWEDPESVVLGISSYEAVVGNAHAQAMLQALRTTRTLLFIGFGAGLEDPNFSSFLRWTREVFAGSPYRHYRLARAGDVSEVQRQHPEEERLLVLPYGESYDDLAPFLRSLKPTPGASHAGSSPDDSHESVPTKGPIRNVPHARNPDFTGREDKLELLASALNAPGSATVVQATATVQAIHGLGGVGKTQLAVEYTYRHAQDYDIVWWLRAEDAATLAADYAALGHELALPEAERADQRLTIAAVRRWLQQADRRWLLVFDNAESDKDIADYLPGRGGHVLLTSRNRHWPRSVKPVELDVLEPKKAVRFLLQRTGQDDEQVAETLADELGNLPLALAQAGAYIDSVGLSLQGSLERYRAYRAEVLSRGQPDDYPFTVATTWELSFQAAAEQEPTAEQLMTLLSFVAPDAIPLDLLAAHADQLPAPLTEMMANPVRLDDAIAALHQHSLLEVVEDQTVSIHRLAQFVARERLSYEDRQRWASAVVKNLNASFPDEAHDFRTWQDASRLLAHAIVVTRLAKEFGGEDATSARLLNNLGRYLASTGLYNQAHQVLQHGLAVGRGILGPNSPEVAESFNNLGHVLRAQGSFADARANYEQALAIKRTALLQNDPDIATALNGLALTLQAQGDLAGAQKYAEQALKIWEDALPPNHPDIGTGCHNLALVLHSQEQLVGARVYYERALGIRKTALPPDHPDIATTLSALSLLLQTEGDLSGARTKVEQALAIQEKTLPKTLPSNRPEISGSLTNLAVVLHAQGDLTGARSKAERALAIREAMLPANHPELATSLNNLAVVLLDQGDIVASVRQLWKLLILTQYDATNYPEAKMFYRIGEAAIQFNRRQPGIKLLVTYDVITRFLGYGGSTEECATEMRQSLAELDFDEVQLERLRVEVEAVYRVDRGRRLVATAFPELGVEL